MTIFEALYRVRNRGFFAADLILLPAATLLAFAIRFEGTNWSPETQHILIAFIVVTVPIKLAVFFFAGMYRRLWRYASVADLEMIVGGSAVSGAICGVIGAFGLTLSRISPMRVPLSILVLDAGLTMLTVVAPRFLVRSGALRD